MLNAPFGFITLFLLCLVLPSCLLGVILWSYFAWRQNGREGCGCVVIFLVFLVLRNAYTRVSWTQGRGALFFYFISKNKADKKKRGRERKRYIARTRAWAAMIGFM